MVTTMSWELMRSPTHRPYAVHVHIINPCVYWAMVRHRWCGLRAHSPPLPLSPLHSPSVPISEKQTIKVWTAYKESTHNIPSCRERYRSSTSSRLSPSATSYTFLFILSNHSIIKIPHHPTPYNFFIFLQTQTFLPSSSSPLSSLSAKSMWTFWPFRSARTCSSDGICCWFAIIHRKTRSLSRNSNAGSQESNEAKTKNWRKPFFA